MASNFPTSLDTLTTLPAEGATIPLATNHVTAHQNIQDALEAIEAKVGVDSSAITTTHDYKLSTILTIDKALPRDAAATTTNKILGTGTAITLGSDAEGDTYYRTSGNVLARLARGTDNYILKMNGNVPNWEAETAQDTTLYVPTGMISPYAGFTAPTSWLLCDGTAVSRATYPTLFSLLNPSLGTVTMTIATPSVATLTAHGLVLDDVIYFTTTGALPTGVTANTRYYILSTGLTANDFQLSATKGGSAINTSGSQSGVHTISRSPYGVGDGSTTFNTPNLKGSVAVGRDSSQTEFNAVGETGGAKTHTLTESEMPAHTHGIYYAGGGGAGQVLRPASGNAGAQDTTSSTGGGTAHNNLQPYISLNYIIKT